MAVKAGEQISDIDSEISLLQDKIRQLQRKKSRLQTFTLHCMNLKLPIFRLPAENLIEIFSYALPEVGVHLVCQKAPSEGALDTFRLASTCYSWRKLLLSQPLFWSKVTISLPNPELNFSDRVITCMFTTLLNRLNICYRRSENVPMSLMMKIVGSHPPEYGRDLKVLFGRIAFGARRWQRIRILGNLFKMPYQLGEVGYPNLRHLDLTDRNGDFLIINQNLGIFGPKAPNLSSLHLGLWNRNGDHELNAIYETSLFSSIGSHVTDLMLVVGGICGLPDVIHLQKLVLLFPSLSKLTIHILATSWSSNPEFSLTQTGPSNIPLPNLTSLDVRWGPPAQLLSTFFFHLVLPELQHLTLEVNGLPQGLSHDLLEWVKSFPNSLRSASLGWDTRQSTLVIGSLLQILPGLPKLSLRGPGAGDLFEILEMKDSSGQLQYLRSLTHLALHPRLDTRVQFLKLISSRTLDIYNDNTLSGSQLKHIKVYAPQHLIRDVQPTLSSLVKRTNYSFSVEYEVDREPGLSLGREGLHSQLNYRALQRSFSN